MDKRESEGVTSLSTLVLISRLNVGIFLIWQRSSSGCIELSLVIFHECCVDLNLGRSQGRSSDELEGWVAAGIAKARERKKSVKMFRIPRKIRHIVCKRAQLTRRAFWRATGKAFRSYSLILLRFQSIGGSSFGGR